MIQTCHISVHVTTTELPPHVGSCDLLWPLLTVYPKKYAHGFVVLCFVVVMQSFIMNSHEVFIHIHQGCFACTEAIVRLPQCQWSKPDGYGKISQCITTTKHNKAKTVCIFLGIYCRYNDCVPFHTILIMILKSFCKTIPGVNAKGKDPLETCWTRFNNPMIWYCLTECGDYRSFESI